MHSKNRAKHTRGVIFYFGGVIALICLFALYWRVENHNHPHNISRENLISQSEGNPAKEPNTIEVGMLVNNIYNFEPNQKTFDADGWVWLKWSPEVQDAMTRNAVAPQDLFYFFNQVNGYDAMLVPSDRAYKRTPDGRFYAKLQFSGHFFANELDFRKFPFQVLNFPMALELRTGKNRLQLDRPLAMRIDHENSGIGAYVDLGGYTTRGFHLAGFTHVYESSLGDPDFGDAPRRALQARMEIIYQKSPVPTVLKILLPLVAVMALSLLSPSISAIGWDVRVGIPPTALLSLIFLQQTYQNWLPELPYITFLDTIYNVCYIANLILFGLFLWGTNTYSQSTESERPAVIDRIDQWDARIQKLLLVMIAGMVTLNWFVMGIGS